MLIMARADAPLPTERPGGMEVHADRKADMLMNFSRCVVAVTMLAAAWCPTPSYGATPYPQLDPAHPILGTLESEPANIAATNEAGLRAVVVGISWDRCEPQEGKFNSAYLKTVQDKIEAFRAGGKLIVLDFGVQYPPGWLFKYSTAHFVNQYGLPFESVAGSGDCGVNLVFSEEMREKCATYLGYLFRELGDDFFGIRLGGGRYGELGYPGNAYKSQRNCYWGFDPVAQGRQPGLPAGQKPCPVPGWLPGTASPDHDSARRFLDWYMESMRNYHDWQISEVRSLFHGPLFMLYPSTGGLRPGQLEAAVKDDCNGSTGPEKTGEVGRGYDMARFVAGITDPQVVVYTTWVDGFPGCDDGSANPARWNPAHYLASLAAAHQPPLLTGGENTGHPDDMANMAKTLERLQAGKLVILFWAFEPTLFDGKASHATLQDFKKIALMNESNAN